MKCLRKVTQFLNGKRDPQLTTSTQFLTLHRHVLQGTMAVRYSLLFELLVDRLSLVRSVFYWRFHCSLRTKTADSASVSLAPDF